MEKFLDETFNTGSKRMVAAIIFVLLNMVLNLSFNGYNFNSLGNDIELMVKSSFDGIETTAETEASKIVNDPDDAKRDKFDYVFEYYEIFKSRPDEKGRVARMAPIIKAMDLFYTKTWLTPQG